MRKKQLPPPHPEHDTRQCRALFARMSEYLDQEMDTAGIEAMQEHLRHCPPCRSCLATLARTVALCHALPIPEPDVSFSRRLRATLARLAVESDH